MKKASGIINIVLGIAVLILFYLHFSSAKSYEEKIQNLESSKEIKEDVEEAPVLLDASDLPAYAGAVAYIDQNTLYTKCKNIKSQIDKAENRIKQLQSNYQEKYMEFQKKSQELNTSAQTANEYERSKLENEYVSIQNEMQTYDQNIQNQVLQLESELQAGVKKTIKSAIEKINDGGHFDYVMLYTEQLEFLIPFNDSLNITNIVIESIDGK